MVCEANLILAFLGGSIELYVMLAVAASIVLAIAIRPNLKGETEEHLLGGSLQFQESAERPQLEISCENGRRIKLVRRGVPGVTDRGAVSLAIEINAFSVTIEERVTPGRGNPVESVDATFLLDFLKPHAKYHIRYNSSFTASHAVFWFVVLKDERVEVELKR